MKRLLLLIILGLGAWYAYHHWWGPVGTEEPDPEPSSPAEDLARALTTDTVALPESLAALRAEADALWDEIASAGGDPLRNAQSPHLARLYAQVLRGTYDLPSAASLQEQLIERRLAPLADVLFFSPFQVRDDPTGFFVMHSIARGERLDDIGREYGLSFQHINIMRGADPESGQYGEGEVIKVYRGKDERFGGFLLHIDKAGFFMDVYLGGLFARRYAIGHGAVETPTPSGETRIVSRIRDPQWTNPATGQVLLPGDPEHILGPVWLAFDATMIGVGGLGIHGFSGEGPATGVLVSNGCIRLRNEDAMELYHLMVPTAGSPEQSNFRSRVPMRVVIVDRASR